VNCRTIKPLDKRLIDWARAAGGRVLVAEENILQGGLGSAILEFFNENGASEIIVKRIGIPDRFIEHGPIKILKETCGLDVAGISDAAREVYLMNKTINV
jgi:1-deoxy-D-xylulose-5-phosphate synthase